MTASEAFAIIGRVADTVTLRAFTEDDLGFLDRLGRDPDAAGTFLWTGFTDPRARRRRFEEDGYVSPHSTALAVRLADGTVAGLVSWQASGVAAHNLGARYEIGAALLPEHRGRGIGTLAQRALVDHLFRYTRVHRLEAFTEAGNLAERRTLERVGFTLEGVLRQTHFRDGAWRDAAVYALIRDDGPA
ncbi:hypothetical protein Ssi03_02130 [Sphaerisporangium siamense]|nr:hypothetical protein Ssi03_02130 [Sphaerisporangium siamense]